MTDLEIVEAIREGWQTAAWECTDAIGLDRAKTALRDAGAPVATLIHDLHTRVNTITLEDGRELRASGGYRPGSDLLLESDDIWIDP